MNDLTESIALKVLCCGYREVAIRQRGEKQGRRFCILFRRVSKYFGAVDARCKLLRNLENLLAVPIDRPI
jgi:hypothetical protein